MNFYWLSIIYIFCFTWYYQKIGLIITDETELDKETYDFYKLFEKEVYLRNENW